VKSYDLTVVWKNAHYPNKYPINTPRGTKTVAQRWKLYPQKGHQLPTGLPN